MILETFILKTKTCLHDVSLNFDIRKLETVQRFKSVFETV